MRVGRLRVELMSTGGFGTVLHPAVSAESPPPPFTHTASATHICS